MARSFIHEPNTAPMAPISWSHGVVGERLAGALLDQRLEAAHQLPADRRRVSSRVLDVLVIALVLERVNHRLERLVIFVGALLHAEDDVAVHLDEAAVAVPGEARVAGLGRERFDGLVVEARD